MARKKGKGRLSDEDRVLWSKVTESTTPLPKPGTKPPEPASTPDLEPARPATPKAEHRKPKPTPAPKPAPSPAPRMDAKAYGRMQRGKLEPDARIDLHGMTLAMAHTALTSFVLRARAQGHRLVLVITGKSRDAPFASTDARGVLRRQVPHWLEIPPLAQAVLQVESAHQRHGGSGAYYVYLRRRQ